MNAERVDVAIVGGGQAGLATSWHLKRAGVEHVILEAGRIVETWRSRRWDSFCLVTPNWSVKLPGGEYAGPDPDGYLPRDQLVAYLEGWAASFEPPVRTGTTVLGLGAEDGGFKLSLADSSITARSVVVATGTYRRPHRPAGAGGIDPAIVQLDVEEYKNPGRLPPGAVLVVGSGQSGCQLAEELHENGRRVLLSCGRCPWAPRRLDGLDIIWWLAETGFADRTPDTLPDPGARLIANVVTTGHGGGHDLHIRTLHAGGVELLGHFTGAEGTTLQFADDVAQSSDFGDERFRDFWKWIENYCARSGRALPRFDWPAPLRLSTRTEVDAAREGIGTIIWTSGFRPDYGWVDFPVFDGMGFPIQVDGATSVPGLYFVGVHYMRKLKSAILYGVGEDAEIVAEQIVRNRK